METLRDEASAPMDEEKNSIVASVNDVINFFLFHDADRLEKV